MVGGDEAIWHVTIDDQQHGPMSRAQVLKYLHDGQVVGSDLIWRPGFSDWKLVSDLEEFWHPPRRGRPPPLPAPTQQPQPDDSDQTAAVSASSSKRKVSLWNAANAGLVLSVLVLLLQIANGRGFELASYAQTASTSTIAYLAGQILGVPLIFTVLAGITNIFKWQSPSSEAPAKKGATIFACMLAGVVVSLALYGHWFFGTTETISGATRDDYMSKMQSGCIQKQKSLNQGLTDELISKYCWCLSEQMAANTTYKQLASDANAPDVQDYLRRQAEAAGQTCQGRLGR